MMIRHRIFVQMHRLMHDIELDTNLSPLKKKTKIVKRRAAMSLSDKLAILDWLKDEKSKG